MAPDPQQLATEIIRRCEALGFAAAGVCGVEPTRWRDELLAWLDAGKHGEMSWLKDQLGSRLEPALILDGARSILMVADLYVGRDDAIDDELPAGRGRIARYCRGRDYHKEIKKRLHKLADGLREAYPGEEFRSFVDTAPMLERELAARCGIGWTGKHTLIINEQLGSYLLLGGFATTMDLAPPDDQRSGVDRCGSCTRCIDACPTDAITPYSVDARRCISYLTIEHEAPIEPGFHEGIGQWLVGCDICQEVCPHNAPRNEHEATVHQRYAERRDSFDLLGVLGWSEGDRRSAFSVSAMKRITLTQMKRNAIICAGNALRAHHDDALKQQLIHIAGNEGEAPLLRETASTVLESLTA
jgi:epoxyqueuosine reductase